LWRGYSKTTAFAENNKTPPTLRQVNNRLH
jgi:hypothetical protein